MQVFKLFFKIIRKNLPLLTIYIVVFVSISAIFAQSGQTEAITEFTESRASVAFVNRDSGSVLIDGLIGYMAEKSDLVDLPDDAEAIQDALLTRQSIPNSTAGIYAEMLINNYLNTAARYVKYAGGISQEKLTEYVAADLSQETDVSVRNYGSGVTDGENLALIFNFWAYPLIIILILGISTFMIVFNDTVKNSARSVRLSPS